MIDIFCAISIKNANEIMQLSSCGILLMFNSNDQVRCRLLGFGLGGSEIGRAKIQAAKLALAAVNPACRKLKIIMYFPDETVLNYLRGNVKGYEREVDEFVRWVGFFEDIGFVVDSPNNENLAVCRSLASKICLSQQEYDSQTVDHLPDEQD